MLTRKQPLRILFVALVVMGMLAALPYAAQASTIPTLSIVSVTTDTSVTIKTANFPANVTFTIRMGEYGTYGVGGYVVGTLASGSGGTLQASYPIPAALKGRQKIAIRADGTMGYYAYDWFTNSTTAVTPQPTVIPGYTGYPTFSISSVKIDESVTIAVKNLPANQTFTVQMGKYGTYAKGGLEAGTFPSGTGGAQTLTFNIPAGLKGNGLIAIRMDAPSGHYAYNWFYNQAGDVVVTPVVPPGYTGIPTFSITSVVRDVSVTVHTKNLPPNQKFTVKMGSYGSYGIGGTEVTTFDSGAGGAQDFTFTIPAGYKGSNKIALRMDSNLGYFAYNWFYNNSTN